VGVRHPTCATARRADLSIHEYAASTGVKDLADQHDHYLYGQEKHDAWACLLPAGTLVIPSIIQ
jgi:hypothetical protein